MDLPWTDQRRLTDAVFVLALAVWITSLATMMWIGYMIAPVSIPLFIVGLVGRCTWRRAVLAAMGLSWAVWMLWNALG